MWDVMPCWVVDMYRSIGNLMWVDPEVIEEEEVYGSCVGRLTEVWLVRAIDGGRGDRACTRQMGV